MILSMAGVKIISEIDDILAKYYVKFVVKLTDDGIDLLKFQGNATDKETLEVTPKMEFYQHKDLNLNHTKAVAYWGFILLWLVFMKEFW